MKESVVTDYQITIVIIIIIVIIFLVSIFEPLFVCWFHMWFLLWGIILLYVCVIFGFFVLVVLFQVSSMWQTHPFCVGLPPRHSAESRALQSSAGARKHPSNVPSRGCSLCAAHRPGVLWCSSRRGMCTDALVSFFCFAILKLLRHPWVAWISELLNLTLRHYVSVLSVSSCILAGSSVE